MIIEVLICKPDGTQAVEQRELEAWHPQPETSDAGEESTEPEN